MEIKENLEKSFSFYSYGKIREFKENAWNQGEIRTSD